MESNGAKPVSGLTGELPAPVEHILEERARRLAQAPADPDSNASTHVLVFGVRNEQYAVDLRALDSVQTAHGLSPVPCTPSRIAGIANMRGEVITVINMAVVMGVTAGRDIAEGSQILLVQLPEGRVGLLVDRVIGIRELALDRLAPSLTGNEYTVGIDQGTTVLVRLDSLLTAERLDVLEHVE